MDKIIWFSYKLIHFPHLLGRLNLPTFCHGIAISDFLWPITYLPLILFHWKHRSKYNFQLKSFFWVLQKIEMLAYPANWLNKKQQTNMLFDCNINFEALTDIFCLWLENISMTETSKTNLIIKLNRTDWWLVNQSTACPMRWGGFLK